MAKPKIRYSLWAVAEKLRKTIEDDSIPYLDIPDAVTGYADVSWEGWGGPLAVLSATEVTTSILKIDDMIAKRGE